MNAHTIRTLALLEAHVRLRRPSTLVALVAVMVLTWLVIPDPAGGQTLMAAHGARVRYTSSALALGSASQATILLALVGFYLLRGRMAEDVLSGLAGVIAASPAGGTPFLLARFCGGVLYLGALCAAFAATVLVCHAVRGEGPIQPFVYLQTYVLVLGPMVLFTAGCAALFDGWAPLMGKAGDVLYFFVWIAQFGAIAGAADTKTPVVLPVDFSGMTAIIATLSAHLHAPDSMMVGLAGFDRKQAPLTLPDDMWSAGLVALRCAAAVLALAPLWLATRLFHRFSPDRVKPARSRSRRSPLAVVDGWLRPLARLTRPLFGLAGRMPGMAGQALADVALTLAATPSSIALLLLAQVLALALPLHALPGLALACVACWGVIVSDLPVRDLDAACAGLTAALPGGAARRYRRQLAAALLLGAMFCAVAGLRLAADAPVRALALVAGVGALAALGSLLGRASGSARLFLVLFLAGLYVGVQVDHVAAADIVGFHGAATVWSVLGWMCVAIMAAWAGHMWNHRALAA